ALIGYGKMGKMIEQIALERQHEVVATLDQSPQKPEELNGAEAVIEFSVPQAAINNIRYCIAHKIPIVVGTTGWYDHFEAIKKEVETNESALFYATNFSLGVNILFHLNKKLAAIMGKQTQYNINVHEVHHTQKLDSPSGTA